ncbi:CapA family protein [bacterium]|nr:CapA family protein [bacterium]
MKYRAYRHFFKTFGLFGYLLFQITQAQIRIQRVDSCNIAAVGDIMVHDSQIASAWNENKKIYDFTPSFQYVKHQLSRADLTIGNLETTTPGQKKAYSGYPLFGAPDALIEALKYAGFDLLSTANNHACDKGRQGLIRTLNVLDTHKIAHCGTYRNKKEYEDNRILVLDCQHIRLAFLNYTYGTNGLRIPSGVVVNLIDSVQIAQDMSLARAKQPDVICVLLHAGAEYRSTPDDFQKKWIHLLLDEGADIVLGTHPHVVQPFLLERRRDKYGRIKPRLVIYSLGNFISNQKRPHTDCGIIFSFTIKKYTTDLDRTHITMEHIHYSPLMVYEAKTSSHHAHYLLPVHDFIQNQSSLNLPFSVHRKLLKISAYYKNHLKSSSEQIKKFVQSQKFGRSSTAVF